MGKEKGSRLSSLWQSVFIASRCILEEELEGHKMQTGFGYWDGKSSNKNMASAYVMFLVYELLCVVNLLQAQLFDQQDCEILASVKNTMADLPGGISFLSTWEFAANVDPCESFTGVECITVDGVNRVGSLFLGPRFAGAPGLLGTLSPSWESLVYLTQLTMSAGEVKGLIPYSVGNLQNLQIFF